MKLVNICNDEKQFKELETEWEILSSKSLSTSPFLTWTWMYNWWHEYKNNTQLSIIYITDNNNSISALLPLYCKTEYNYGFSQKVLRFLGTETESSDYLDILSLPGEENENCDTILQSEVFNTLLKSCDLISFHNHLEDSLLSKYLIPKLLLQHKHAHKKQTSICPFLPLQETTDLLLGSLSKNMKSGLRRTRNKLSKDPNILITTTEEVNQIDKDIADLFALHTLRFVDKEQETKFTFANRGAFHIKIANSFLQKGWLKLYKVIYQNRPIGILYCYEYKGIMMYMQAGFDPEFAKFALGNQLILHAIDDAISHSSIEFDFMRGNEAYKQKWTDKKRYLFQKDIALSLKGVFFVNISSLIYRLKKTIKKAIFSE